MNTKNVIEFNFGNRKRRTDSEVSYDLAQGCITLYCHQHPGNDDTKYVSFMKDGLINWLQDLSNKCDYDTVRISLGIYTPEFVTAYAHTDATLNDHLGRVAIFICLFKGDNPAVYIEGGGFANVFDLGHLNP